MKKKMLFLASVSAILLFSSCKKDWSCDCVIDTGVQTATVSSEIKNVTKSDAEEWCETQELNAFYSCDLKSK